MIINFYVAFDWLLFERVHVQLLIKEENIWPRRLECEPDGYDGHILCYRGARALLQLCDVSYDI